MGQCIVEESACDLESAGLGVEPQFHLSSAVHLWASCLMILSPSLLIYTCGRVCLVGNHPALFLVSNIYVLNLSVGFST